MNLCGTTQKDHIAMFKFPKDQMVRDHWTEFCGRTDDWQPKLTSTICEKHFRSDCIVGGATYKRLKPNTVPYIKFTSNFASVEICSNSLIGSSPQDPQILMGSEGIGVNYTHLVTKKICASLLISPSFFSFPWISPPTNCHK